MFGLELSGAKLLIIGIICFAIFAAGGGTGYKVGHSYGVDDGKELEKTAYDAALKQQKDDAKSMYDMALKRNLDLEAANKKLTGEANDKAQKDSDAIDDLAGKLAARGRLRDPFAKPGRGSCGTSPVPGAGATATGGQGLPAETSELLSEQFTGFLRSKFREADHDAEVAAICHNTWH